MHKLQIAHLDIKPDNILFDEFFNIKVSDFGTSILLLDTDWTSSRRWGTRRFMAPEVDKTTQLIPYNVFKADIYSLGVTLMVLTGNQQKLCSYLSILNFSCISMKISKIKNFIYIYLLMDLL